MASLRDVAAAAGVAVSTASRALNPGDHPVSADVRDRVRRVAEALGYRPDSLARALAAGRLAVIGALVHDVRDSYFGDVLRGIEDTVHAAGYLLVICNTDRDRARELHYVEWLVSFRVAGLIFVSSGLEDAEHNSATTACLQTLTENGGHAVALAPTRLLIPRVVPDNRGGAREAALHVLSLGLEPILVLAGPQELCTSIERLSGFADAFAARGRDLGDERLIRGAFRRDSARDAVAGALQRKIPFRAVLAANDEMAIGALLAIEDAGLNVPDDIVVVGFGDMREASLVRPPLTTVKVPKYELGQLGAQALLDALGGSGSASMVQTLPVELVVRQSTSPRGSKAVVRGRTKNAVERPRSKGHSQQSAGEASVK